jgi:mannan endo-1,4-beta-mannosidase
MSPRSHRRPRGAIAAALTFGVSVAIVAAAAGASLFAYHRDEVRQATVLSGAAAHLPRLRHDIRPGRLFIGAVTSNLPAFDRAIGMRANLTVRYLAWGRAFPESFTEHAAAAGAQVMIALEPRRISLQSIVSGRGNGYLEALGEQIRSTGARILMSFGPEMDGRWYSWGYGHVAPQLFARAFRHVHDVLTAVAGKRITWVWQISHVFYGNTALLRELWPGDRYVSIVGLDGYYEQRADDFASIFGPAIRLVRTFTNRPVLLTETSAGQRAGQARKIPNLFAGIRRWQLCGLVWFDIPQRGAMSRQDWRLEGHRAATREFRRGLRSLGLKVR